MERMREPVERLLENHGVTILFALLFVLVFQIQRIVFTYYSDAVFVWLFTAESASTPTPGWVLSLLAHGSIGHLAANSSLLLVAGGLSEPHLRKSEYIAFFFVTGGIASLSHIAIWPLDAPSLGASGAVFAFMGYSMYHYAQQHQDRLLPRDHAGGEMEWVIENLKFAYVLGGFLTVLPWLILAFFGVYDTGDAADGAHLFGFLLGMLYVYLQPALIGQNCD